jgi:uncharacterized protein YdeI (YjbR/CyaY-like superfamily)
MRKIIIGVYEDGEETFYKRTTSNVKIESLCTGCNRKIITYTDEFKQLHSRESRIEGFYLN